MLYQQRKQLMPQTSSFCSFPDSPFAFQFTAAASGQERPRGVFRRGDWYARKETRRGDEIDKVRPEDAPRRHVFALCHSFQDDYQSSCGLTTVGIIANFRAFAHRMPSAASSKPPYRRPSPLGQPATISNTRIPRTGMTAKTEKIRTPPLSRRPCARRGSLSAKRSSWKCRTRRPPPRWGGLP